MACTNHPDVESGLAECSRCGKPFCGSCLVFLGGRLHCAVCKSEQVRDLYAGTDRTELALASIGRRFAAIWLDGLILMVPTVAVLAAAAFFGSGVETFLELIAFPFALLLAIPGLLYEGLMLSWRGQTVGKIALRIKVVTPSGEAISAGQAWGRVAIRSLLFSLLTLVNYLPAFFTKERTCVHDLVARTRVVQLPF
jgi:uncharacterized RDD family membrane protein YckC